MKEQNSNAANHDERADQHTLQSGASEPGDQTKKAAGSRETVKATTVDPKEAKHGVDYCCGSCGG